MIENMSRGTHVGNRCLERRGGTLNWAFLVLEKANSNLHHSYEQDTWGCCCPDKREGRAGKANDADKKFMTAPEGKKEKNKNHPPKEAQDGRRCQVAPLQFN